MVRTNVLVNCDDLLTSVQRGVGSRLEPIALLCDSMEPLASGNDAPTMDTSRADYAMVEAEMLPTIECACFKPPRQDP